MNAEFTILIADRNRHIREFLQRELISEGYKIQLTNDGREVLRQLQNEPPDLLILDLEMPYADGLTILDFLQKSKHGIPVIVHVFSPADMDTSVIRYPVVFVEKGGNNIDGLKAHVARLLAQFYPRRFPAEKESSPISER